uniref:peptidylprolyl isomerase n=1 Tax=Hucho hucho TaxID=62062 RepID=A0A4W5NPX7_9TELE
MKAKTGVILVLLAAFVYVAAQEGEGEQNVVEELLVETLVKPETCSITSEMGDTLQIHYTGKLLSDGKVIDSSLSRDPLVVELGKKTVIPGLILITQKIRNTSLCFKSNIPSGLTTIPPHLAYGKRGYPPTIPADAALEFEVEVMSLIQATPWQKMVNDVFPLVCLGLVPTLLGMVGLYLYNKANAQRPGKKKAKDKKSKKK